MGKYGRARHVTDENIVQGMCFTCWITKATDTDSEYVILTAFLWQHWLHECASMFYMYVASLVSNFSHSDLPVGL